MEHDFIFAADEFHHKTKFANEMWQTDFTYFKVKGWGWYYLSTVIDDYSRYIIHWELRSSMTSDDVPRTIDKAILNIVRYQTKVQRNNYSIERLYLFKATTIL